MQNDIYCKGYDKNGACSMIRLCKRFLSIQHRLLGIDNNTITTIEPKDCKDENGKHKHFKALWSKE